MRVLLDASAAHAPGSDRGIGRYLAAVRDANRRLGNDVDEFWLSPRTGRVSEMYGPVRRAMAVTARQYDLAHAPTAYYAFRDIRRRPSVTSILDVIPLEFGAHRKTGIKAGLFHRLARRSEILLTLSNHAADRIEALLRVDRDRIVVAPLPPAQTFRPDGPLPDGLPRPYVALVADCRTPDPRKRIDWVPGLAALLHRSGVAIVVMGGGSERLAQDGVTALGRVDDDTYASVLRGAEAFVYTSAYEGQGLPPLEAIACGTPVVGMSNTAIPEVVGDAGILIEEAGDQPIRRLAEGVIRVIGDPVLHSKLVSRCPAQADRFTPQRFTEQIGLAYTRAAQAGT